MPSYYTKSLTPREVEFLQEYGKDLDAAYDLLMLYVRDKDYAHFADAWKLYYSPLHKKFNKGSGRCYTMELKSVSPNLAQYARNLELYVPGLSSSKVCIRMFSSQVEVMNSKQKPCVMVITGENGKKYKFLLKGHEDLRQDERVMQFLKMINRLLEQSPTCEKRNLSLVHYPVVPLSNNSGLIYWVPN